MPPAVGDLAALASRQEARSSSLPSLAALQQSLSWQLVTSELELARAHSQISRVEAWGRPEVELEWEHVPSLGGDASFDAIGVRLSVPLPLGTAGRQARAAAAATLRASELDAKARQQALANQLSRTVASITVARDSLRELEDVLASSADAEHSLAEQFRLGTMTYLSYIDGLSRLDAARSAAVDARLELLVRHIQLYHLLGDLAPVSLPVSVEAAR
jgi:outer membrane protein TolC